MAINGMTCLGAGVSAVGMFLGFSGHVRTGWLLLGLGVLLDGLDGTLVRSFDLKSVCPEYDGERLDEYADLLTFVIGPVGMALATGVLPTSLIGYLTAGAVIGGSCLQFSYQNAKTEQAFWGFPSYWNVIYFYLWALGTGTGPVIGLSWALVILLFVPLPFIYPSRTRALKITTNTLAVLWGIILVAYLVEPSLPVELVYGSLLFPVYYVGASFIIGFGRRDTT